MYRGNRSNTIGLESRQGEQFPRHRVDGTRRVGSWVEKDARTRTVTVVRDVKCRLSQDGKKREIFSSVAGEARADSEKHNKDLKQLLRRAEDEARGTDEGEAEISLEPQAAPGEGVIRGKCRADGIGPARGMQKGRERRRHSRGRGQTAAENMQKMQSVEGGDGGGGKVCVWCVER